jgi:hypothetical protein
VADAARLEGGIITCTDDMVNISVNVYPSAIESIVRRFSEVLEFLDGRERDAIAIV